MNLIELFLWAAHHRFPQLVLADGSVHRAGLDSWGDLICSQDKERTSLVERRVQQWNALEVGDRGLVNEHLSF